MKILQAWISKVFRRFFNKLRGQTVFRPVAACGGLWQRIGSPLTTFLAGRRARQAGQAGRAGRQGRLGGRPEDLAACGSLWRRSLIPFLKPYKQAGTPGRQAGQAGRAGRAGRQAGQAGRKEKGGGGGGRREQEVRRE